MPAARAASASGGRRTLVRGDVERAEPAARTPRRSAPLAARSSAAPTSGSYGSPASGNGGFHWDGRSAHDPDSDQSSAASAQHGDAGLHTARPGGAASPGVAEHLGSGHFSA